MRALMVALLVAVAPLAGCAGGNEPEESTEESSAPPTATEEGAPASEPANASDGVGPVTARVLEQPMSAPTTAPSSAPAAEPTTPAPAPTAQAPASPSPAAEPAPSPPPPAPEPTPAPTPTPTPAPTAPPTTPTPTPSPTPTSTPPPPPPPPAWPREGSFVEYRMTSFDHDPPGQYYEDETDARLTLRYANGAWTGTCAWTRSFHFLENDTYDNTSGTKTVAFAPLREPTDVEVGDKVTIEDIGPLCDPDSLYGEVPIVDRTSHSAPRQPDGSDSWYAYIQYEWPGEAYAYWDTKTGLVLAWRDQGHYSYQDGWMVDTDAPLS